MYTSTQLHNLRHRLLDAVHRKRCQHRHFAGAIRLPCLDETALGHLDECSVERVRALGSAEMVDGRRAAVERRGVARLVDIAVPAEDGGVEGCGARYGENGDFEPTDCAVLNFWGTWLAWWIV